MGQRVVIRRLVRGETGPTGGPAFIDALGICTAWGDGAMTLAPADSAPVEIALADIVSGKPVPPKPSHLMRVSAREAELRGLALVPDVETVAFGEWVLRSSPDTGTRLLKRANSCLAMGRPGTDTIDRAVEHVVGFYAERDRAPMAQVERGSETEVAFGDAGWVPLGRGDASFQAAPVAKLHRLLNQVVGPTPVRVTASASRVVADHDHATGSAVLDRDWLCLHGLAVDPDHRRQGLATAVLGELVEWGAERGARTAWLHVETDNAPALALYERLGFSEHHAVRYLVPAP
ncbi:GNAT family N-acetyltransferase [Nocardioides nematodiphilus]|uniref:GNAT family N-acetyltransferase n=1 Tax=Nocardioides nematodiphilus TaxID=2849669 RepID=UPI001CDA2817|nr:GNAT family N-acetyltransferase [Nocardioides nematodiphilus]MCA1982867.1 GNAT family N-acetyltransferase [Nocardioides nematodiphilus]